MRFPDKRKVLDAVLGELGAVMSRMTEAAKQTRYEATHEEARPENDKDTRALEQTYLARGQALRAEELLEQVQVLRFLPLPSLDAASPVDVGALVALGSEEATRCFFVVPHGGGTAIVVEGVEVTVVTPASPIGRAIMGRFVGDELELRLRGAQREYVITAIA